ncbi:hypothetical protein Pint_00616 [Pistacia integerrima]|uniref:Uncharacterized protein n=1 Tax=Pistacia integerrima TaxID=434235 RepID=A0ACC0ZP90_9ROSI|nr:hypothetical protein Pint_00616 [Pistacia integerrima]
MGRAPCCSKVGLHRGPWSPREDTLLTKYIQAHGEGHWRSLPKKAVTQDARKRRNSKNSNHKKNQNYKNKTKPTVEPQKHKVHLPKPIRVTSFVLPINESFKFNNLFSTVSNGHGEFSKEVPCCSFKDSDNGHGAGAGFLVGDHDDDIVNGSDFEYQISQVFTGENTLEKLYEEYLQILKDEDDQVQLDSFAESLLI